MATVDDVQNAIVDVIDSVIFPNGDGLPSVLFNQLLNIAVTTGGTLYTTATVSITGGGGTGASAQAVITAGVITAINIIEPGLNFTSAPMINISGDGSGATATATITPVKLSIAAGDFLKQNVDTGLQARNSFISVFAQQGFTRNTTRLRRVYGQEQIDTATLTATVSGDTVTVGGSITAGQAVTIIVNSTGYSYAALISDTTTTIATALAALIPTATSFGPVVTILGIFGLTAAISVGGTARRVLNSEEGIFRVQIISPNNATRAQISSAIQIGVSANGYYLPMPDGISATIRFNNHGLDEINKFETSQAYIRSYFYLVEYHNVQVNKYQTITDPYTLSTVGVTSL